MPSDHATERALISVHDTLAGRDLTEPRLSPDGRTVAFVASAPNLVQVVEAHVYTVPVAGGEPVRVSPWPVRAGRGLGGGCFDWLPDSSGLVIVAKTGELWSVSVSASGAGDAFRLVTPEPGKSLAAPCVSPDGDGIVMTHDQAQVFVYRLDGTVLRVDNGDHDFVADPAWWNGRPVWHAWSAPHMPWDESSLVGISGEAGADGSMVRVLGGAPGLQIQQPRTDSTCQRLGWVDDSSGWLNVTVVDGETGSIRRANEPFEHALPSWGEGQRSWCFNDGATVVAFVRNENGFGRLCTFDLDTGEIVDRAKAVHGQLSWVGDTLVALRTGGKTPTQIVVYDTSDSSADGAWPRRTLAIGSSVDWSDHPALVEPTLLEVPAADGTVLHARLYSSASSSRSTGDARLLCWVHGGPTDQWQVTFMPRLNYWIDRGYDVLVPDHRGSTGFGRAYTQAMRGRWGDLDVDDVATILEHVITSLNHDPVRIALMGSSAGGLNILGVAARYPGLAAAVVAAYPVTDIAALDPENGGSTHRFEAHYNRSLVGDARTTAIASLERSPINIAARLVGTPLLIMHGTVDPVVSIDQSREFVDVLRAAGGVVELVEFEGEGHGFRQVDSKVREYEITERFLNTHLA